MVFCGNGVGRGAGGLAGLCGGLAQGGPLFQSAEEEHLGDGGQLVDGHVEGESRRHVVEEDHEDEGHDVHHPGLAGVGHGLEFLLEKHGDSGEDGQGMDGESEDGVGHGEVCDPEEGGVTDFDGAPEGVEHGEEDGDLDQPVRRHRRGGTIRQCR